MSARPESTLAVLRDASVRTTLHRNEWWFSVVDVCGVLTGSAHADVYWLELKQRLAEEGCELSEICRGLRLTAPDGEMRKTDCANTEGILRIVQSIHSPKADLFKRGLARVGHESVQKAVESQLPDDLDSIFTMLDEHTALHAGGRIAGDARKALGKRLKRSMGTLEKPD